MDLRIPVHLIDKFTYMGRVTNVKMPWLLAFVRRVEDGPYWAQKPRSPTFMGAGHYLDTTETYQNPPCNAKDILRAGLVVIEAWFGGY